MKKAWIFGASKGGINSLNYVSQMGYVVSGFLDNKVLINDTEDQNSLPVANPAAFNDTGVDKIFIATQYINEALTQLLDLGISKNKLKIVPLNVRLNGDSAARIDVKSYDFDFHLTHDKEVYKTLWISAEDAASVGDIAEFGVGAGRSAYYIAKSMKALLDNSKLNTSKLHLFDTFEGFPVASDSIDKETPEVISGAWRAGSAFGLDEEDIIESLKIQTEFENVKTYKGLYSDTLLTLPKEVMFSMIHLDCDLYESAFQVLEHLILNEHLKPGCLILFDNWFSNSHSNQFAERRAWKDINQKYKLDTELFGLYGQGCSKHIYYGRII